MINCMMSELLKFKRTFSGKLVLIAPLVTLILCGGLGAGDTFQYGAYNWWYTIFLPGALSIICARIIEVDKKLKYNSIFTLSYSKAKIWIGKILACSVIYLISSLIFLVGLRLGGLLFGNTISFFDSIKGIIILFITFLFQIPFCMILSEKFGMIAAILINIIANIIGIVAFADGSNWFLNPFAIPSRLMCAVVNILPNGLPVEQGSILLSTSVVIPGIFISTVVMILVTAITSIFFTYQEGV